MKKEIVFSLIGLILIIGGIFVSYKQFNQNNQPKNLQEKPSIISDEITNQEKTNTISLEEVKKHNLSNDCWIIINKKVYNVTNFNNHPGGRERIEKFCGQDATQAFMTKGDENEPHSDKAKNLLNNFYLGNLSEN